MNNTKKSKKIDDPSKQIDPKPARTNRHQRARFVAEQKNIRRDASSKPEAKAKRNTKHVVKTHELRARNQSFYVAAFAY